MLIVTDGLVLREVLYRDSDKMLTILTRDRGKIPASCPGARSRQGSMRAGTQLLSYSNFTLYEYRGRYSVNAAEPEELFIGLRKDILSLSLASYMAEVLDAITEEEDPAAEVLTTGLNCLYALSVHKKPRELIKAVFELRVMMLAGYAPDASQCSVCGKSDVEDPVFNVKTGLISCSCCISKESYHEGYQEDYNEDGSSGMPRQYRQNLLPGKAVVPLCSRSLLALRYILAAEPKKFLSFSVEEKPLKLLSQAAELYLLSRLEREFSTLDFYKSLL